MPIGEESSFRNQPKPDTLKSDQEKLQDDIRRFGLPKDSTFDDVNLALRCQNKLMRLPEFTKLKLGLPENTALRNQKIREIMEQDKNKKEEKEKERKRKEEEKEKERKRKKEEKIKQEGKRLGFSENTRLEEIEKIKRRNTALDATSTREDSRRKIEMEKAQGHAEQMKKAYKKLEYALRVDFSFLLRKAKDDSAITDLIDQELSSIGLPLYDYSSEKVSDESTYKEIGNTYLRRSDYFYDMCEAVYAIDDILGAFRDDYNSNYSGYDKRKDAYLELLKKLDLPERNDLNEITSWDDIKKKLKLKKDAEWDDVSNAIDKYLDAKEKK